MGRFASCGPLGGRVVYCVGCRHEPHHAGDEAVPLRAIRCPSFSFPAHHSTHGAWLTMAAGLTRMGEVGLTSAPFSTA